MYKEYVLGFAFSKDREEIVLIEKQKPEWQKGKINGIGGKIEKSDTNQMESMIREFREETGVDTSPDQWIEFGSMVFDRDITGVPCKIYLFKMFDNCIFNCETREIETVFLTDINYIYNYDLMHNLPILISLALSDEFNYTELKD